MISSRFLPYPALVAVLLVSACGGQPEPVAQEKQRLPTEGQTETPQQEAASNSDANSSNSVFISISRPDLPDRYIYFDFDSTLLSPDAIKTIDEWVELFNNPPDMVGPIGIIPVDGHTDAREAEKDGHGLGCRRARAVKNAFVERGISATQIHIMSYGSYRPVKIGDNEAAWSKNRRVEIFGRNPEALGPLESNCSDP